MHFGKSEKNAESAGQSGPVRPVLLQELINRGGVNDIWVATDQQRRPLRAAAHEEQVHF